MIVISDSSPLINLACINKIQLLPAIFDQIIIPRSVYEEIRVIGLLGILLEAKKKNLIQNVKIEMDKLISEANFWISQELYTEVLKSASEI